MRQILRTLGDEVVERKEKIEKERRNERREEGERSKRILLKTINSRMDVDDKEKLKRIDQENTPQTKERIDLVRGGGP